MEEQLKHDQEPFQFSKFNQDFHSFKLKVQHILSTKNIEPSKNKKSGETASKAFKTKNIELGLKIPKEFKDIESLIREEIRQEEKLENVELSQTQQEPIKEMKFFVQKKVVFTKTKGLF
jgi:hypothetical protein